MNAALSCGLILFVSGCALAARSARLVDASALDRPIKIISYASAVPDAYSGPVRYAVVALTILEDGGVDDVSVVRATNPKVANAAIELARKWKFEPPRSKSLPVRVRTEIPISWSLDGA
jgi:TonB family protein